MRESQRDGEKRVRERVRDGEKRKRIQKCNISHIPTSARMHACIAHTIGLADILVGVVSPQLLILVIVGDERHDDMHHKVL